MRENGWERELESNVLREGLVVSLEEVSVGKNDKLWALFEYVFLLRLEEIEPGLSIPRATGW